MRPTFFLVHMSSHGSTVHRVQKYTYHCLDWPIHCSGGAHPGVPTARLYSLTLMDVEIPKSVMTTLFGWSLPLFHFILLLSSLWTLSKILLWVFQINKRSQRIFRDRHSSTISMYLTGIDSNSTNKYYMNGSTHKYPSLPKFRNGGCPKKFWIPNFLEKPGQWKLRNS